MGPKPHFPGSHENPVFAFHKLGTSNDTVALDESPPTTYKYMVDIFRCTNAAGVQWRNCLLLSLLDAKEANNCL